jgi:hypothetical protein
VVLEEHQLFPEVLSQFHGSGQRHLGIAAPRWLVQPPETLGISLLNRAGDCVLTSSPGRGCALEAWQLGCAILACRGIVSELHQNRCTCLLSTVPISIEHAFCLQLETWGT